MMMVVDGFVLVSIVQVRVEIRNRNLITHSRFIYFPIIKILIMIKQISLNV